MKEGEGEKEMKGGRQSGTNEEEKNLLESSVKC